MLRVIRVVVAILSIVSPRKFRLVAVLDMLVVALLGAEGHALYVLENIGGFFDNAFLLASQMNFLGAVGDGAFDQFEMLRKPRTTAYLAFVSSNLLFLLPGFGNLAG